jgi:hypothetical protein
MTTITLNIYHIYVHELVTEALQVAALGDLMCGRCGGSGYQHVGLVARPWSKDYKIR